MKIVRRRIWSRFWGLVAVISLTTFAAALAVAAYEPTMANGVRALGSFLERIPVRVVHRKAAPVQAPVAPAAVELLPPVLPPAMPATEAVAPSEEPAAVESLTRVPNVSAAAAAVAAPAAEKAADEEEEWDEEDELHDDEDEMPTAPSDKP
jgi:hypothetical protein